MSGMFGKNDDLGPVPCYFLAEITAVDTETHVCSMQMLRGLEIYDNVKLFRDPGVLNLPSVGDLCAVIWDNRNVPIIIGFYPVHHRTKLEEFRNYQVEEGETITQSQFGQKLLMTKRGEIFLTNWSSQGFEIYEKEGLVLCRSDSTKGIFGGVEKRSGITKRYSQIARKDSNISSVDDLTTATTGLGIRTLVEDSTIIKESGVLATPVYEHKVGNLVVNEDTAVSTDIKNLAVNSDTSLPLRSQTKYFALDGVSYLEVSVDILGNVKIDVPATAIASGVNIEGLLNDLTLTFKNINLGGNSTVSTSVKGVEIAIGGSSTTSIDVGNSSNITYPLIIDGASSLLALLASHTHTNNGADPSAQLTPIITAGLYSTTVTKAN